MNETAVSRINFLPRQTLWLWNRVTHIPLCSRRQESSFLWPLEGFVTSTYVILGHLLKQLMLSFVLGGQSCAAIRHYKNHLSKLGDL